MELLAPAGNAENFFAALEAGADAVYVGAPGFNARNLARDLRVDEIAAMIAHCHKVGKKIYIAANSLLLEKELPEVLKTLAALEALQPDALIVQDLGLIHLLRSFFPGLCYHASTLLGAHNLPSVQYLADLGCSRVVLARELTLEEVATISRGSAVDLEVFIHGAMCFSASGLCLFSSYLGGKSGLRGRCVQPCRRAYASGKKGKGSGKGRYLFSMNDLDGLSVIEQLGRCGVASLKIEGRLRSATYVARVVRAYRLVLDARPEDYEERVAEAEDLLAGAMSRKGFSGYFATPQPIEALTPGHSGNLGLHLGRAKAVKNADARLVVSLKKAVAVGDRLRFHAEPSGERVAVTLKTLFIAGQRVSSASSGSKVEIAMPAGLVPGFSHVDVYKIDSAAPVVAAGTTLHTAFWKKELKTIAKKKQRYLKDITWKVWGTAHEKDQKSPRKNVVPTRGRKFSAPQRNTKNIPELWLRIDSVKTVLARPPVQAKRYLLTLNRRNVEQVGQLKKALGPQVRQVVWALPPIIFGRELPRLKKNITLLLRAGFRSFQVAHISQKILFGREKVFLSGDYSLNLTNNQALLAVAAAGLESTQLAIEADRKALAEMIRGYRLPGIPEMRRAAGRRTMRLGLTVYGAPPLFTSRLDSKHFTYGTPLISPKKEGFVLYREGSFSQTRPLRPFSLLPYLRELKAMGIDYAVLDLTGGLETPKKLDEVKVRLQGNRKMSKLPTFNYLGELL